MITVCLKKELDANIAATNIEQIELNALDDAAAEIWPP